jgi:hypothetical protein
LKNQPNQCTPKCTLGERFFKRTSRLLYWFTDTRFGVFKYSKKFSVHLRSPHFLERRQHLPNRTTNRKKAKKITACRYANRKPNKQEVGFNFAWSGSELWSLLKYSSVKLKNQKHIAVDVLFKGFPMIPLSFRSNLAGRYL